MTTPPPPVLQTARLTLRELVDADLDFVAEMLADAEVMRFYPKRYSRAEAAEWIARQQARYAAHGHALWLVADRATDTPLGQVGLLRQFVDGMHEPEIGYLVHRPYWRRGIASEAALAVREHAFGVLALPRVISLIRPENLPSQGVARRLGMAAVGRTTHAGLEHIVFAVSRPGGAPEPR